MFSWKKEAKSVEKKSNNGQRARQLGQMGLFDVPDLDSFGDLNENMDHDDCTGEDELEAELRALEAGHDIRKIVSRKRLEESFEPKKAKSEQGQEFENAVEADDEEIDENDPELLAELRNIEDDKSAPNVVMPPSTGFPPHVQAVPEPNPRAHPTKVVTSGHLSSPGSISGPVAPISRSVPVPKKEAESTVDILQDRLQNYKTARENAKASGESAKLRRLDRGMKTLEGMLKSARAGRQIIEEDMPPPVALGTKSKEQPQTECFSATENSIQVPTVVTKPVVPRLDNAIPSNNEDLPPPLPSRHRPAPPPPPPVIPASAIKSVQPAGDSLSTSNRASIAMLTDRRTQYRQAALTAKKENDEVRMLEYVKIAKKFDIVISAIEQGQEVDLQGMPPPPPGFDVQIPSHFAGQLPSKTPCTPHLTPAPFKSPDINVSRTILPSASLDRDQPLDLSALDQADDPSVFNAPLPPSSTLDALQQRLQKYESSLEEAKNGDNGSKVRRMGRIVKQYEDAIKAYKAGKPVAFDDLPSPPGFAPIPKDTESPKNALQQPSTAYKGPSSIPPMASKLADVEPSSGRTPIVPSKSLSDASGKSASLSSGSPHVPRQAPAPPTKPAQKSPQSLYEKQLAVILERQQLFKAAAIDAKKRGDLQAAKEYLRVAKGFEPMINASRCGLPVNMDSLPLPPQPNHDITFEIVNHEDCQPLGDRDEMYEKLEKDLIAQIEMCAKNRVYFSKLGDVQNAQRFETMLLNAKKDFDFVRNSKKRGDPVPRFHYETRTFSIVKCCTELGDDDLELSIVKGINYACSNPAEVDTYVRFEFPFPQETPQKDKTATVRDTNNPEYNSIFKLSINRKSRACTSVFKRKGVKLEVWAKGGFLRSDVLLGTATVKLQPLETRCVLHDSFDLMEGRKPIGGKLEVKIRVRDPLITKQVETHCEKWLIVNGNKTTLNK